MWEHWSLRISIVKLMELMLALICLISSLCWWLSVIKALSSWARVVVIWIKEHGNGIGETKGV